MFVRAYLRASTKQQDANRAKTDLLSFAKERGLKIAASYVENESGASLQRPELFRLLSDSEPGDILLIEQVDRERDEQPTAFGVDGIAIALSFRTSALPASA